MSLRSRLLRGLRYLRAPGKYFARRSTGRATRLEDRIKALAQARGESQADVTRRFGREALEDCPRRFSPLIRYLRRMQIEESGLDDDLAYVRLPNGRKIYGQPSRKSHVRQYRFVADLLSPQLTPEAFLLGLHVATRYARGSFDRPFELPVGQGDTVLEVGAFIGHLSMWFAETVGPSGKVIAIEMMPENVRILRRNVAENHLEGTIEVVECGAWSTPGQFTVQTKGMQRNSLADIERLRGGDHRVVAADTLDNILDRLNVASVDVAFVTANGAELEVLKGFERHLASTKAIAIAAGYSTDGRRNSDECAVVLQKHGFALLPTPNPNLVLGARTLHSNAGA